MQASCSDAAEYRFLTALGSCVECRLVPSPSGLELELFGNRAGLLSLANVFLWLVANAWRREFLSLGELGFVRLDAPLAVSIRLTEKGTGGAHGTFRRRDRGESLEWSVTEEELQQVALWMHRLVSSPVHEYDRLLTAQGSACVVQVRITDAVEWLSNGVG